MQHIARTVFAGLLVTVGLVAATPAQIIESYASFDDLVGTWMGISPNGTVFRLTIEEDRSGTLSHEFKDGVRSYPIDGIDVKEGKITGSIRHEDFQGKARLGGRAVRTRLEIVVPRSREQKKQEVRMFPEAKLLQSWEELRGREGGG